MGYRFINTFHWNEHIKNVIAKESQADCFPIILFAFEYDTYFLFVSFDTWLYWLANISNGRIELKLLLRLVWRLFPSRLFRTDCSLFTYSIWTRASLGISRSQSIGMPHYTFILKIDMLQCGNALVVCNFTTVLLTGWRDRRNVIIKSHLSYGTLFPPTCI